MTAAGGGRDVVIVGGGIHGCSTALHVAKAGLRPLVIEQAHVGRHASGVNAGGVRRLGRHPAEVPLSAASMEMWHDIAAHVDDDCGFRPTGQIKVAESEGELRTLEARAKLVQKLGFSHEQVIGREDMRSLLPSVSEHCVGGLIVRDDGYANPFRTVMAFRRRAERLGACFVQGVRANRIERKGSAWRVRTSATTFEAPILVNCAGAWADRVSAQLGEPVPLTPEAPMLFITERLPPFLRPVVGATGRPLSFKQFQTGTVLVGGGHRGRADRDTAATEIDFRGIAKSAETAKSIFPIMDGVRVMRCWAGIEGVMPDEIPVIGPSESADSAFHAFGFSAHGFQLGPIVGRIIAELVVDGRTTLPIAPFRISRFNSMVAKAEGTTTELPR